ncbi:uncharacterized protein conserved in bacteria [Microbacterium testaceum StLB037]|uniref:Uncharacterized protein conserved in bacteria n=1 Tax=Microbacterium testaceum (strain StLB037) TaxID=979556 RepID=E8NC97_MICTS|nr:glycosyltransferase [Microbacterium testaceum]BAJ73545.1 uncharacterized protein conserved in bacteria [Microbacterium testaceum StLB037]
MRLGRLRESVRRSRELPVVGPVVRAADRIWWARTIGRSELVDAEYYGTQLGFPRVPRSIAIAHYVAWGFRRGMSLNPLFDDIVAGGQLPEVFRVPALYAYLLSERETVRVHPWWDAEEYGRKHGGPGLEHAWTHRDAEIELTAAGHLRRATVDEMRRRALAAARTWRRHRASRGVKSTPGDVGLIRPIQARDRRYDRKLAQAAARAAHDRVIVPLVGVDASQWVSAHLLADVVPELGLSGERSRVTWPAMLHRAAAALDVDVSAVLDSRAEFTDDEIDALVDTARAHVVALPVHRAFDGTVLGVGAAETGGAAAWGILAEHPVEDLDALDAVVDVPLVHGLSMALPHAVLRETLERDAPTSATAFARALRSRTGAKALTGIRPVLEEPTLVFAEPRPSQKGSDRDRGVAADLVTAAGFDVLSWRTGEGRTVEPVRRWRRPTPDAERWAIKICAPAGRRGAVWGDMHFARGLAAALRRRGHTVVIDAFDARARRTADLDDVSVVVRGPYRIDPVGPGVSLQWIISHPDDLTRGELAQFDRVFAASERWSARTRERWGIDVQPLLEATDTDLFHPRGVDRTDEIVFVGTARGIARPSVVVPLRAGLPVRVYGPDWRPFIPHSAIAAQTIAHAELPRRYESASIVLNDQWPAMRRQGFIAMRPFDVVAVGGRVISEDVDGIEEIFGGAVIAYRDERHLLELLEADPDEIFPDRVRLGQIAERVRAEHSFDARAAILDEAARSARSARSARTGR